MRQKHKEPCQALLPSTKALSCCTARPAAPCSALPLLSRLPCWTAAASSAGCSSASPQQHSLPPPASSFGRAFMLGIPQTIGPWWLPTILIQTRDSSTALESSAQVMCATPGHWTLCFLAMTSKGTLSTTISFSWAPLPSSLVIVTKQPSAVGMGKIHKQYLLTPRGKKQLTLNFYIYDQPQTETPWYSKAPTAAHLQQQK